MDSQLILFGTGEVSRYYTQILQQLFIKIEGYVDNDRSKWGMDFLGKKIEAPNILKKIDNLEILIACADTEAVIEQLDGMHLKHKIITKEHVIRKGIEALIIKKMHPVFRNTELTNDKKTIIVDNLHGSWGGAEDWAHKVALCLLERDYDVYLIESTEQITAKGLEKVTLHIEKKELYEMYLELIERLLPKRPFSVIEIWSSEVLWAAAGIKRLYPEDVQIISSVLVDEENIHKAQYEWDDYIDSYLCFSSRIKNKWIESYGIDEKKVFHNGPFIENTDITLRKYENNDEKPLKIIYPCRLERIQKRADLLPELINKLEKKSVNYILNIIGDGPCKKEIMKYINENNLHNKVKIYEWLSKKDLITFLANQEIYLNISEFEGTSLTMLEAMAKGCVPVVTDVSGVDDFVVNGVNGLVSNIGDINSIADNILYLDKNREKIEEFGYKSTKIVCDQCDLDRCINFIEKMINS